jgi:hypothetical protein
MKLQAATVAFLFGNPLVGIAELLEKGLVDVQGLRALAIEVLEL